MEELFYELKTVNEIYPPIYKIDGMIVTVRLFISYSNTINIEIMLQGGNSYIDTGNTYEDFCKIIDGLKDIKFDTLSGEFINPNKLVQSSYQYKILSMFHHPNIEMEYSECCVCFEYTKTKTECNHHLCLRCTQKIKKNTCPLCRGLITNHLD